MSILKHLPIEIFLHFSIPEAAHRPTPNLLLLL